MARGIAGMMSGMGLWTGCFHLITAAKILTRLPVIALLILFKEIFGLLVIIVPGIKALLVLPTPRAFDFLLDPIPPSSRLSALNPVVFVIGSLSNFRSAITQGLLFRWNLPVQHLAYEADIIKFGNLFVLAIELALLAKDKSDVLLTIGFFQEALSSLFFLCLGFYGHSSTLLKLSHFLLDIEDGKIGEEERKLGLEGLYQIVNGQGPAPEFVRGLALGNEGPAKLKGD
jgi:hypothetical protein